MEAKTKVGSFIQDEFGLWHHNLCSKEQTIVDAVKDACNTRQKDMPVCYFWWMDTFAPMRHDDTPQTLYQRWTTWRELYQATPAALLRLLDALSPS